MLYLPSEHKIFSFIYKSIGKRGKILVKYHHGFRRTNKDIIESARRSGFEFVSREDFDFLSEFRRSVLLNGIMNRSSLAQRIFSILGRWGTPTSECLSLKK